ncbi:DUF4209 domain-containing protein [Mycobacterium sp. 1245111.1]|uniref:DUF4209 domain-containing protein n=1 Tax=Mycobacterium sp. 1245111.1 TaxID=1834073 RepID=UPI000AC4F08C|nr:DUF4209 domain-containing protein [Mycobacterium sp. 1245111.1]
MSTPEESATRDLVWYAAAIDRAATAESVYSMAHAIRDEVGIPLFGDLPTGATIELRAVCWVFDYAVEFDGKNARLAPRVESSDQPDPPPIKSVDSKVRQVWRDLLDIVATAPARARIAHALFQCGGSAGPANAAIAVDNYIASAQHWRRQHDSDEYLRIAARIARIVGDSAATQRALEYLLDGAQRALDDEPSDKPGYVLRPLDYAVNEPDCPARVDELLERAAVALDNVRDRERALTLISQRCTDNECRRRVWERRVNNFLTAADSETGIIKMILRQDALKCAETSTFSELKELAAAALQSTRHEDLGLMHVHTSAAIYQEHFEQVRDQMAQGATWQEALISFAQCGPLSGDYDQNCATIEQLRAAAPLVAYFPDKILGPDGLPIYEAIDPDDRFDGDLTKWEAQVIGGNLGPLTAALHSIPDRFGIPDQVALAAFLSQWPTTSQYVMRAITLGLQRFWCGDYEGVVYAATPWIEAAIRQVILDANQGIYTLQSIHKPGQYPGLGAMIDLLPDRFTLSRSRYRFLKATLTHPLGINLRNRLSHGIELFNSSQAAALVLHTLLTVTLLTSRAISEDLERSDDG